MVKQRCLHDFSQALNHYLYRLFNSEVPLHLHWSMKFLTELLIFHKNIDQNQSYLVWALKLINKLLFKSYLKIDCSFLRLSKQQSV